MSTELLYTSAPQGLRHGSRGFCTVITTAGMPINVIGKLESISSYRHLFAPDSPRAGENPIVCSHQRLSLAGNTVSVLSRVAAYGTDYSGRTNKIAHHLILDASEMAAAGPAWLLRQKGLFRSEWLGQCETPAAGPAIPSADQPARICTTWKTASGDAGWGGVVAEAIIASTAEPLWVIYALPQREMLLEMMDESISLIPGHLRWRATFSTFAANIPPDVDCKIRFVPAGTQEAKFASGGGNVIDLTKHQSITAASNLVERARGVARGEATSSHSGSGFSAVTQQVDAPPVQSTWSSLNETSNEPPPTPGPPSLPTDVVNQKARRKQQTIALGIFGAIFVLASTWAVARHLAGLPILSLSKPVEAETAVSPSPNPAPNTQPAPPPVLAPIAAQDMILHYDRRQLLDWAIQQPTAESPSPAAVQLRGTTRVRFVSSTDSAIDADSQSISAKAAETASSDRVPEQTASDSASSSGRKTPAASLISWGSESQALFPAKELRVQTTRLNEGAQTIRVQQLPYAPAILGRTTVYWSHETDDLVAIAEVDFASPSQAFSAQATAYRNYAVCLSRLASLITSIRNASENLPSSLQTLTDSLRSRANAEREGLLRSLIRSETTLDVLTERAGELSETLQRKSASLTEPMEKEQQSALLRVVTDCEKIGQAANDCRRELAILRAGETVPVPDLIFLGDENITLRRIPLRFHYSW